MLPLYPGKVDSPLAPASPSAVRPTGVSRRFVLVLILVGAAFAAGFIPEWRKLRDEAQLRQKAEHALTLTRLVKDLGSAAVDARRGQYEAARQEASAFFNGARYEIDAGSTSTLSAGQRLSLQNLSQDRDTFITALARSDPSSADRLTELYVAVRKVAGV